MTVGELVGVFKVFRCGMCWVLGVLAWGMGYGFGIFFFFFSFDL